MLYWFWLDFDFYATGLTMPPFSCTVTFFKRALYCYCAGGFVILRMYCKTDVL